MNTSSLKTTLATFFPELRDATFNQLLLSEIEDRITYSVPLVGTINEKIVYFLYHFESRFLLDEYLGQFIEHIDALIPNFYYEESLGSLCFDGIKNFPLAYAKFVIRENEIAPEHYHDELNRLVEIGLATQEQVDDIKSAYEGVEDVKGYYEGIDDF